MNLENLVSSQLIGWPYEEHPVESPRPEKGRVQDIRPVRGCYYHYILQGLQTIQLRKKLVYYTFHNVAAIIHAPHGGNGIQFIEEYDSGRHLSCLAEYLSYGFFRFSYPLGEHLRPPDADEVGIGLVGHCLGDHSLSRARRTVEKDSLGRAYAHLAELLRLFDRPLDGFDQFLFQCPETPQVAPVYAWYLYQNLSHGRRLDLFQSRLKVLSHNLHLFYDLLRNLILRG